MQLALLLVLAAWRSRPIGGREWPLHIGDVGIGSAVRDNGRYPFVAALVRWSAREKEFKYVCSGSVVTNQLILTVGSCVADAFLGDPYVYVGEVNLQDVPPANRFRIRSVWKHPRYQHSKGDAVSQHDIAILKLMDKIDFARLNVSSVSLVKPDDRGYDAGRCLVLTWLRYNHSVPDRKWLHQLPVTLAPEPKCSQALPKPELLKTTVCVVTKSRHCQYAVSGGLLMCHATDRSLVQVGVMSPDGCKPNRTEIMLATRLAVHHQWIMANGTDPSTLLSLTRTSIVPVRELRFASAMLILVMVMMILIVAFLTMTIFLMCRLSRKNCADLLVPLHYH